MQKTGELISGFFHCVIYMHSVSYFLSATVPVLMREMIP